MADLDHNQVQSQVDEDSLVLELADLLPDESGEVVLFTGDEFAVNLVAEDGIRDAGISDSHVTAGGVDVTGFHYYSFENGVTVYGPGDLLVVQTS